MVPEECGESRSRSSPAAEPGRDDPGLGEGLSVSSRSDDTDDKGGETTPESCVSFMGEGVWMNGRCSGRPGLDKGSPPEKNQLKFNLRLL